MTDGFDRSNSDWSDDRTGAIAETDRLLARAVAGDAQALSEIRARGAVDPALLEELALWQADELRLARAARMLDDAASLVEVPPHRGRWRTHAGLGWAVAAVLAVVLAGQSVLRRGDVRPAERAAVAGIPGFASADDAFDAYVSKAREEGVLEGEIAPPTLLRSRELGDGRGFEVVIVRQVVERRISPQVFRIAPVGEVGRLRAIEVRPRTETVQ